MSYREYRCEAVESPIVCVWELRGHSLGDQRVVPDGHAEVIAHLATPCEERKQNAWLVQPPSIFCGQITRPLLLRGNGETFSVGVRLKSWATRLYCEDAAAIFTDHITNIRNAELLARVAEQSISPTGHLDLRLVFDRFLAMGQRKDRRVTRVRMATSLAHRSLGRCGVDALAQAAGVSARHLDRVMLDVVGLTPKLLLRMIRFQHLLKLAERPNSRWAYISQESGYTDQSHMLRDFWQFVGTKPSEAFNPSSDLARCFLGCEASISQL